MNNKRPFVPSFLQKFDDKLLRYKPDTWAARTHFVIYFSSLFALCLAVLCWFTFSDARYENSIGIWTMFVSLLVFIGFIFWLIFLLRFNVFKRYGNWSKWSGLKTFCLYFISISAMVAIAFIPYVTEIISANRTFSTNEIVKDINEMNITACQLEYEILPKEWKADTCIVDDNYYDSDKMRTDDYNYIRKYIDILSRKALNKKLIENDSCRKIGSSMYIFYKSPDYIFADAYNLEKYSNGGLLTSGDIYNTTIKNYQKPDRKLLLQKMKYFKDKYAFDKYNYYDISNYDYNQDFENSDKEYDEWIKGKYNFYSINNGLNNIVRKKYSWVDNMPTSVRIFFYTSLVLTLAVFIFRHTTIKTFFLTLLTTVILLIITALIIAMGNLREIGMLNFILFYFVIFAIIALTIKMAKVRSVRQGIALNSFMIATPFIPLVITALYIFIQEGGYKHYRHSSYTYIEDKWKYYLSAEIIGVVILLLLLEPVFRRLYRKWYALPEN
ncbi:MAG: hypothetical protein IPJ81_11940 [Chitinophagaceae bacterium]|nr:hypothetical protein [Chitinophagaceae bacterium]